MGSKENSYENPWMYKSKMATQRPKSLNPLKKKFSDLVRNLEGLQKAATSMSTDNEWVPNTIWSPQHGYKIP